MPLLLLTIARLGLCAGTEITLRQALRVSASLGLSPMFVGLTIPSIGTDLPERVLSIEAGLQRLGGVHTSDLESGRRGLRARSAPAGKVDMVFRPRATLEIGESMHP